MLTSYHQTQMWKLFLENKTPEMFKNLGAVLRWCENYYNLMCCQTFTMQGLNFEKASFYEFPYLHIFEERYLNIGLLDAFEWWLIMTLERFCVFFYLSRQIEYSHLSHTGALKLQRKVGVWFLRKYYSAGWLLGWVPPISAFLQQAKIHW